MVYWSWRWYVTTLVRLAGNACAGNAGWCSHSWLTGYVVPGQWVCNGQYVLARDRWMNMESKQVDVDVCENLLWSTGPCPNHIIILSLFLELIKISSWASQTSACPAGLQPVDITFHLLYTLSHPAIPNYASSCKEPPSFFPSIGSRT